LQALDLGRHEARCTGPSSQHENFFRARIIPNFGAAMATFFVVEARFNDGTLDAARICTPVPTGDPDSPDHGLSAGSVLAVPELAALVELADVQLVVWTGPGPVDWYPIDRLVVRNGVVICVNEEGTPTDSLQRFPKTLADN